MEASDSRVARPLSARKARRRAARLRSAPRDQINNSPPRIDPSIWDFEPRSDEELSDHDSEMPAAPPAPDSGSESEDDEENAEAVRPNV